MSKEHSVFSFIAEAIRNIFDLDKGLPGTIKQMFVGPKVVVDSYWNKEEAFFPPIRYIIIIGIIYALIWELLVSDSSIAEFSKGLAEGFNSDESSDRIPSIKEDAVMTMIVAFNRYLAYLTIAFLPLYAGFTYLLFRADKATFLKHIIVNAYISGQMLLLYLVPFLGALFSYEIYSNVHLLVFPINMIYFYWATLQCFNSRSTLFKLGYLLAFLVFNILSFLIMAFLMWAYLGYYSA